MRAIAIALLAVAALAAPAQASQRNHCTEDSPTHCWDWATMGNHHRGIVTMHGTPLVVSPCRFQRLMHEHNIDYRGQYLKGDKTALRLHC